MTIIDLDRSLGQPSPGATCGLESYFFLAAVLRAAVLRAAKALFLLRVAAALAAVALPCGSLLPCVPLRGASAFAPLSDRT